MAGILEARAFALLGGTWQLDARSETGAPALPSHVVFHARGDCQRSCHMYLSHVPVTCEAIQKSRKKSPLKSKIFPSKANFQTPNETNETNGTSTDKIHTDEINEDELSHNGPRTKRLRKTADDTRSSLYNLRKLYNLKNRLDQDHSSVKSSHHRHLQSTSCSDSIFQNEIDDQDSSAILIISLNFSTQSLNQAKPSSNSINLSTLEINQDSVETDSIHSINSMQSLSLRPPIKTDDDSLKLDTLNNLPIDWIPSDHSIFFNSPLSSPTIPKLQLLQSIDHNLSNSNNHLPSSISLNHSISSSSEHPLNQSSIQFPLISIDHQLDSPSSINSTPFNQNFQDFKVSSQNNHSFHPQISNSSINRHSFHSSNSNESLCDPLQLQHSPFSHLVYPKPFQRPHRLMSLPNILPSLSSLHLSPFYTPQRLRTSSLLSFLNSPHNYNLKAINTFQTKPTQHPRSPKSQNSQVDWPKLPDFVSETQAQNQHLTDHKHPIQSFSQKPSSHPPNLPISRRRSFSLCNFSSTNHLSPLPSRRKLSLASPPRKSVDDENYFQSFGKTQSPLIDFTLRKLSSTIQLQASTPKPSTLPTLSQSKNDIENQPSTIYDVNDTSSQETSVRSPSKLSTILLSQSVSTNSSSQIDEPLVFKSIQPHGRTKVTNENTDSNLTNYNGSNRFSKRLHAAKASSAIIRARPNISSSSSSSAKAPVNEKLCVNQRRARRTAGGLANKVSGKLQGVSRNKLSETEHIELAQLTSNNTQQNRQRICTIEIDVVRMNIPRPISPEARFRKGTKLTLRRSKQDFQKKEREEDNDEIEELEIKLKSPTEEQQSSNVTDLQKPPKRVQWDLNQSNLGLEQQDRSIIEISETLSLNQTNNLSQIPSLQIKSILKQNRHEIDESGNTSDSLRADWLSPQLITVTKRIWL
ncbi:hypothetical protein O181_028895 [Austropuccinia psidii MF-1]|uniref:Uncharacterized protein n=1 Tax=Austropuccinia psidii MF-1 TaxID=1389203 RepID=A0A9Q3CTK9_9BASI|nr:hypothetical protein [Austropuccinia psidii MF-1]